MEDLLAQTQSVLHLTCHLHAATLPALTTNQESQLYRIAQEAVRNVIKHTEVQSVCKKLAKSDGAGFLVSGEAHPLTLSQTDTVKRRNDAWRERDQPAGKRLKHTL